MTENVKDFAGERGIVRDGRHLASVLNGWAVANPEPYLGLHWPVVGR